MSNISNGARKSKLAQQIHKLSRELSKVRTSFYDPGDEYGCFTFRNGKAANSRKNKYSQIKNLEGKIAALQSKINKIG